jgi:hypothetical protein
MESEILYRCKSCGSGFCGDECGSIVDKMCLFCIDDTGLLDEEYEEREDEDYW